MGREAPARHVLVGVAIVCIGAIGLATGCGGGGGSGSSERTLMASGVGKFGTAVATEKRCERLFAQLSKDLDGDRITTAAALKSHQMTVRACFDAVKKRMVAARSSFRQILTTYEISDATSYSEQEINEMAVPEAAAYVGARIATSLNRKVNDALGLVNEARLGEALGAGSIPGSQPEAISTLLFLEKYRANAANYLVKARDLLQEM